MLSEGPWRIKKIAGKLFRRLLIFCFIFFIFFIFIFILITIKRNKGREKSLFLETVSVTPIAPSYPVVCSHVSTPLASLRHLIVRHPNLLYLLRPKDRFKLSRYQGSLSSFYASSFSSFPPSSFSRFYNYFSPFSSFFLLPSSFFSARFYQTETLDETETPIATWLIMSLVPQ